MELESAGAHFAPPTPLCIAVSHLIARLSDKLIPNSWFSTLLVVPGACAEAV
jgi:hypothetical protein